MSTKFFTNSEENTLLNKLEGIFKHTSVYYFDVLVGYFMASGYFRIRKFIDNVAKIRILGGINVDKLIGDAALKGLEFNFNSEIQNKSVISTIAVIYTLLKCRNTRTVQLMSKQKVAIT